MASICTEGTRSRIVFLDVNRKRRSLTLGEVAQDFARAVAGHVDTLVAAAKLGFDLEAEVTAESLQRLPRSGNASRDRIIETIGWLRSPAARSIWDRLEYAGLVTSPAASRSIDQRTLGGFLDSYLERRMDNKPGTVTFYGHTVRNLKDFFGTSRSLESITVGDAKDFYRYLESVRGERGNKPGKLSAATVARRQSLARTFFQDAVDRELLPRNPFPKIRHGTKSNKERQRFITPETIERVIDACPSTEWQTLVALARYGGLRIPSEPLLLRWGNIDWANDRMVIHSPKTERHEGKGLRVCPLFPEIRQHLEALYDLAQNQEPGSIQTAYIFRIIGRQGSQRRDWRSINLRTQFERIILRAGIAPWPKLWHNLRASRQTELTDRFPAHVVAAWLGNTEQIAREHYLQVTEAHLAEAVRFSVRAGVTGGDSMRSIAPQAYEFPLENEKPPAKQGVEWAIQDSNL